MRSYLHEQGLSIGARVSNNRIRFIFGKARLSRASVCVTDDWVQYDLV